MDGSGAFVYKNMLTYFTRQKWWLLESEENHMSFAANENNASNNGNGLSAIASATAMVNNIRIQETVNKIGNKLMMLGVPVELTNAYRLL